MVHVAVLICFVINIYSYSVYTLPWYVHVDIGQDESIAGREHGK